MNTPGSKGTTMTTPTQTSPLSIDQMRTLAFIIRCARLIRFLQPFLPYKLLPKDERIPSPLLKRLLAESKKIIPKGTPPDRKMSRSPSKLGMEFFFAIAATRLSGTEFWRAGHTDFLKVLEEAYCFLFALGLKQQEKKRKKVD